MKLAWIVAPLALSVAACGSSGTSTPQDPGLVGGGEGDTSASTASDTNPDGVPYPTENIGTHPRNGDAPGNVIKNYKFLGYPGGDVTKGLQPVSLADYFDPEGKKYKLIHVQASGVWCIFCRKETEIVTPLKEDLEQRKVVWLISLAEGATQGVAATDKDLKGWLREFKAPYTHLLDPGNKNFGPFYDAAALPWNANIDARTMEILSSVEGAATSKDVLLDDVDYWLNKINSGEIPGAIQ